MDKTCFQLDLHPVSAPQAVVQADCWRITVLTPALLRLEYDPSGTFEDRATQTVWNRAFPVPEFHISRRDGVLELFTEFLHLTYDGKPFSPNNLQIQTNGGLGLWENTWRFGDKLHDLGGTARTLDRADGAIPLESGLISRFGFSVLDDSHSMVLQQDSENPFGMWVQPRPDGIEDLYFFGYGYRYQECLRDFYHLCGKTPLLPRWALGNWWSRYHKYSAQEYQDLMERFSREGVPFSVAVLDMDWHLVDVDPKYGSGWTGYTWNRDLFPDPPAFLDWLHAHGLRVTLNVHPADGVRAFEKAYPQVAEAMGIDPASGEPVPFDVTNPTFLEAYFEKLHHPLEAEGVDFWWVDWQQGTYSKVPGLDPLWMLNHCHYLDSARRGRRPMTFSRYAGPGSHRYPVGFSGDTIVTWESLRFQPYFTVTASNIGYGWWSHDIGGHMLGYRDDELATRWVQFGVFSPINRLHSSSSPFNSKEPWNFPPEPCAVMKQFLRLRHRLVPYLYTMGRLFTREGQPLMRPMYWLSPQTGAAYSFPNEYAFGTELVCAPITEKCDPVVQMARADAWLPEGVWVDAFTGRIYSGGRRLSFWRPLSQMPVLARGGGIIPLQADQTISNDVQNPQALEVFVFPGSDGSFTLWEDIGDTPTDLYENWASTHMAYCDGKSFTIDAPAGNLSVLPPKRCWCIVLRGVREAPVQVAADGKPLSVRTAYDPETHTLRVALPELPTTAQVVATFPQGLSAVGNDVCREVFRLLNRAQMEYRKKQEILSIVETQPQDAISSLMTLDLEASLLSALCEILQAQV